MCCEETLSFTRQTTSPYESSLHVNVKAVVTHTNYKMQPGQIKLNVPIIKQFLTSFNGPTCGHTTTRIGYRAFVLRPPLSERSVTSFLRHPGRDVGEIFSDKRQ